jgi:hypothetical protein
MVGGMQWQVNESRGVDDISKGLLAEKSQFRSLRDLSMVGCGPAAMQPFGRFAVTKQRLGDHGRIASADWPVLDWRENLQLGGPLQT